METDNALLDSIKKRGQNSYYYAHAPRTDCDDAKSLKHNCIVTGGPPQLITSDRGRELTEDRQVVPIRNYSWCDEDEKVTLYIPSPTTLQLEDVQVRFGEKSLELRYPSDNWLNLLQIKDLKAAVVVEDCKYRVRNNKILITLKKEKLEKWYSLTNTS